MSGQSIVDRINAAKYSIAGQGLAKSVHKATTEEILGPKKKHVDYLVQCTKEPNVSIPQLANLLIERTQHQSWVVVFKALITIHNLMNYGNERFTQYLASNNCSFQLDNFFDKTTVQAHDMSKFIRRYAKYIHEKSYSYRLMAFDFCKIKRGKDDGVLRTMNGEKLLKTLPVLQGQLDALIEFDATPNELTNNVIHTGFILLFKDLIRLFACYNDGIINLLEKYFEMNKKQCKEGLDVYKKFLVRMEQVSEFLKVAENMGVDKGDIPDLAKEIDNNTRGPMSEKIQERVAEIVRNSPQAPSSLLDALESHLQSLEGKKGGSTPTGSAPPISSRPAGFTNTVNNFSKATANVAAASNSTSPTLGFTDDERQKALEQEEQTMQQLKMAASSPTQPMPQQHANQQASPTQPSSQPASQSTNPFASAIATTSAPDSVDLFGSSATFQASAQSQPQPLLSDDLLGLGAGSNNPFTTATSPGQTTNNFMAQPATNPWSGQSAEPPPNSMGFGMTAPTTSTNNDINFEAAFGNQNQPSGMGVEANSYPLNSLLPPPATMTLEDSLDPLAPGAPSMQPTSPGIATIQATSPGLVQTTSPGMMSAAPAAPAPRSDPLADLATETFTSMGLGRGTSSPAKTGVGRSISPAPMVGSGSISPTPGLTGRISPVPGFDQPSTGFDQPSAPSCGSAFGAGLDFGLDQGLANVTTQDTGGLSGLEGLSTSPGLAGLESTSPAPSPIPGGIGDLAGLSPTPSPLLSPAPVRSSAISPGAKDTGYDGFGDVMQPVARPPSQQQQDTKLIKQDLDSSLANIVGNLNINGPGQHLKKTEHQWSPSANKGQKTGGANWQAPMPSATFSSWSQPGMGQQSFSSTSSNGYMQPTMSGVGNGYVQQNVMTGMPNTYQPQVPVMNSVNANYNYNQPYYTVPAGPRPAMGMQQQQQPGTGVFPAGTTQPQMGTQPNLFQQQTRPQQTRSNDPFGAL